MSTFDVAVAFTAVAAGAVASIAGFGVGSLLTPLLTVPYGAKLAVAMVAFPPAVATFLRFVAHSFPGADGMDRQRGVRHV